MNADELRTLQAPLKDRYRAEPDAAIVTLRAQGSLDESSLACKVETGRAIALAGLHPATGGAGLELCSGDMLLEALVACAGVTLKAVATAIGVTLRAGRVSAEGDIDFRGTLGVAKDAPVGFKDIRLAFALDTDASEAELETLLKLTERYCVVLQTIKHAPKIEATLLRQVA
jgi:uncharacterized OsmC-like protein